MRLIDADAFIEDIKTEIVNLAMDGMKGTPRSREELYQIIERIGEQPTAYDVEAKVAELEKVSFERFGNDGMGGQKVVSLDDAISIVRGKE